MTASTRRRPGRGRPGAGGGARRGAPDPTQTRLLAYRVLLRVESAGAYADLTLRAGLSRSTLTAGDRALATELVYGTLRWRGRLDHLLAAVLDRKLADLEPRVLTLLRLGAYQVIFADNVPNAAAVDQSVRVARASGVERAASLVNAVLRRLSSQAAEIPLPELAADPRGHLMHALSMPGWIAERMLEEFGPEEAAELATASNAVPPLVARVHARLERAKVLDELVERFPDATACMHAPYGVRLGHRGDPGRDPAFMEGRITIQDEASQLVIDLLDPQPGESVLDVCAAPGTKATAAAERVGERGRVVALDRSASRLRLVGRDARRLGLGNLGTAEADATRPLPPVAPEAGFDRVLVDAPCSGLGTLRRHPDARWRVRAEDPARLAEVQQAILRNAATALRPGGTLVYSTCTFLPEENEAVVEAFLREHADFRRAATDGAAQPVRALLSDDGWLRTLPHQLDTDAFRAVRLERTP